MKLCASLSLVLLLPACGRNTRRSHDPSGSRLAAPRGRQEATSAARPPVADPACEPYSLATEFGPGDRWIIYVSYSGTDWELRARVLSGPGKELVLWRSPRDSRWGKGETYYIPSPDLTRVALGWRMGPSHNPGETFRVWVVDIPVAHKSRSPQRTLAPPKEITSPNGTKFVFWRSDDELSILSVLAGIEHDALHDPFGLEYLYDLRTGKTEFVERHAYALDFLQASFREPIKVVEELARTHQLPTLDDGGLPDEGSPARAVLRGLGLPPVYPLGTLRLMRGRPLVALSPDRTHLALAPFGNHEILVYSLRGARASLRQRISLSRPGDEDVVSAEDLRWSAESDRLTFTEGHSRQPAVIRLYSPKDGQLTTLHLGQLASNAFLLPKQRKEGEGP